jgi:CRISPR-associated protein Cas1
MPSAYLDTPYLRVKLHSERLIVLAPKTAADPKAILREIPFLELERLVLNEHVQITTEAVAALLRRGIPLHYLDYRGGFLGQTLAAPGGDSAFRLQQFQRGADPGFGLTTARSIVAAKIGNQLRLLQRADAYRDRCSNEELDRFNSLQTGLEGAANLDAIRGFEGAASAHYFVLWARYLPPEFPFERRRAHPPGDPVNACISYAATLIYHELVTALHERGLDPGLGHLHVTDNGRWSLALDLMEPFRPAVIESLTLRVFNLGMFAPDDFEPQDGGVYLKRDARKQFVAEYERRMQRSFLSEHAGHRTTLRQQLREQAVLYKTALTDPAQFRPFRLN